MTTGVSSAGSATGVKAQLPVAQREKSYEELTVLVVKLQADLSAVRDEIVQLKKRTVDLEARLDESRQKVARIQKENQTLTAAARENVITIEKLKSRLTATEKS